MVVDGGEKKGWRWGGGMGEYILDFGNSMSTLVEGHFALRARRMKGGDAFGDSQGA